MQQNSQVRCRLQRVLLGVMRGFVIGWPFEEERRNEAGDMVFNELH